MLNAKSRLVGIAYVGGPLALLGPAFVAAIAYIDPGNFATNITAGSKFGHPAYSCTPCPQPGIRLQVLDEEEGAARGVDHRGDDRSLVGRPGARPVGSMARRPAPTRRPWPA